ncbi:MAG: hypothetical protein O2968_03140 [Acidobacteria bacterium]|nr:hypothetical protein [Acidobacteriota bacterium]
MFFTFNETAGNEKSPRGSGPAGYDFRKVLKTKVSRAATGQRPWYGRDDGGDALGFSSKFQYSRGAVGSQKDGSSLIPQPA